MTLAKTAHGTLHYEVVGQTAPWQKPRDAILFHHGIGPLDYRFGGQRGQGIRWHYWPAVCPALHVVQFDGINGCVDPHGSSHAH
jgi:hypothetical protein